MSLIEALQSGEFAGMTAEQALSFGNETIVVGGSGGTLWSYSGVEQAFGILAAEGLLAAIQGAGMPGAAAVYTGKGMQLNLQSVQDKLTAIGGTVKELTPVCDALKEIGITHAARWSKWGVENPTVDQVAAAMDEVAKTAAIESFKAYVRNEILTPQNGDDVAALKAKIAAVN